MIAIQRKWKNYSSSYIANRYNSLAAIYPIFEKIFMLPGSIRCRSVSALNLHNGGRVLEIGCGTGRNLSLLRNAVGNNGVVYGIDISEKMLEKSLALKKENNWHNVELILTDALEYIVPEKLNAV